MFEKFSDYPPVLSKEDFVRRYKMGEFGNASPTWDSIEDWVKERSVSRLYHVRSRIKGAETFYNLSSLDTIRTWDLLERKGAARDYYISEMAPHEYGILQGELERTTTGWYLYFNRAQLPMRDGFEVEALHLSGPRVLLVLEEVMNPLSYDWLMTLLYRYPYHVIEFSTFGVDWGTVPGHNTVFWEVRKDY